VLFAVQGDGEPGDRGAVVRCDRCGLRRLDPRPAQDQLDAYYQDSYYSYLGRTRSPLKQRVWDAIRDVSGWPLAGAVPRRLFDIDLRPRPGARVVDVGCGYGDLLIYLKSRGCDVLGVEFDPRAAEKGAEYGIPIHVGELPDTGLEPGSIDEVVLQHSLEHVPDPAALVAEIARVLRPGGQVHVAVPNGASAGLEVQNSSWGCLCNPHHFWYFDEATLVELHGRHGLAVRRIAYANVWRNHLALWRSERPLGAHMRLRHVAAYLRARRRGKRADLLRAVFVKVGAG
jgi:SAM-dependent methyltransferase